MTESQQHINTESDEISLKELILKIQEWWRYLLSKWIIILSFGLLGGALGFLYANSKEPIYIATTTFVLEEGGNKGGLGSIASLASIAGLGINSGGGIFQGDNILELYKSRKMIEKTLFTEIAYNNKNELLLDRYIDFNQIKDSWDESISTRGIKFLKSDLNNHTNRVKDSLLSIIIGDITKNYLKVSKPDPTLSIIKAEVKAKDEFFAKTFNEQIVKNVNDFYIQTKTKKSLDDVVVLQRKRDSVMRVMNGAIYTASSTLDATPNLNPTRQTQRVVPVQRSQFTVKTSEAVLSELIKNLEMSKLSASREAPLIEVVDGPIYPLNVEKLGKLKGLIIGGFLFGFLTVLFLIVRKLFKNILQ